MKHWILDIAPKLFLRMALAVAIFFVANAYYEHCLYSDERNKFSPVAIELDSAFSQSDVVYLGESSNTSFNPWTDTFGYSISQFVQMHLPNNKVASVSHDGVHLGIFEKMLALIPPQQERGSKPLTLLITLNMRTCGPSAMFSDNEASNQQEAVFYARRLPLLNRMFVSLHHYDNRNAREMEGEKVRWFRTHNLAIAQDCFVNESLPQSFSAVNSFYPTAKSWLKDLAQSNPNQPEKIRNMADAYVKEFAFVLNDANPRIHSLKRIAELCKQKDLNVVFVLLMPNRDHAKLLFGNALVSYIDFNLNFLRDRMTQWGISYIDIPTLYREKYGDYPSGHHYTDQWYPTEHVDGHMRQFIAEQIASEFAQKNTHSPSKTPTDHPLLPSSGNLSRPLPIGSNHMGNFKKMITPKPNNLPNWNIKMPLSDTLLQDWQKTELFNKHFLFRPKGI